MEAFSDISMQDRQHFISIDLRFLKQWMLENDEALGFSRSTKFTIQNLMKECRWVQEFSAYTHRLKIKYHPFTQFAYMIDV